MIYPDKKKQKNRKLQRKHVFITHNQLKVGNKNEIEAQCEKMCSNLIKS